MGTKIFIWSAWISIAALLIYEFWVIYNQKVEENNRIEYQEYLEKRKCDSIAQSQMFKYHTKRTLQALEASESYLKGECITLEERILISTYLTPIIKINNRGEYIITGYRLQTTTRYNIN